MRVIPAFSRLLALPGIWVHEVEFADEAVVVTVALRRRLLRRPECSFETRARYDRRSAESTWRHLDLDMWRLEVRAKLRRLDCPVHVVRTKTVPLAQAE